MSLCFKSPRFTAHKYDKAEGTALFFSDGESAEAACLHICPGMEVKYLGVTRVRFMQLVYVLDWELIQKGQRLKRAQGEAGPAWREPEPSTMM